MNKMAPKSRNEIGIVNDIKVINMICDDCGSRDNCIVSQAVEKNLKHPEKGYGVLEAIISFWIDCCPYINAEAE